MNVSFKTSMIVILSICAIYTTVIYLNVASVTAEPSYADGRYVGESHSDIHMSPEDTYRLDLRGVGSNLEVAVLINVRMKEPNTNFGPWGGSGGLGELNDELRGRGEFRIRQGKVDETYRYELDFNEDGIVGRFEGETIKPMLSINIDGRMVPLFVIEYDYDLGRVVDPSWPAEKILSEVRAEMTKSHREWQMPGLKDD